MQTLNDIYIKMDTDSGEQNEIFPGSTYTPLQIVRIMTADTSQTEKRMEYMKLMASSLLYMTLEDWQKCVNIAQLIMNDQLYRQISDQGDA